MKLFFFFHSALSLRWAQTSILLYEYVKLHVHWGYRQILFGLFRIGLSQVKLQISFYLWTIISLYKYCCRIIGGTSWRRLRKKLKGQKTFLWGCIFFVFSTKPPHVSRNPYLFSCIIAEIVCRRSVSLSFRTGTRAGFQAGTEKGFNRVVTKQFLRFLRHKNQAKVDYKCVKIIAKILLSRNQKAKVAKETLVLKPPAPGFVVNCVAEGTRLTFPS